MGMKEACLKGSSPLLTVSCKLVLSAGEKL